MGIHMVITAKVLLHGAAQWIRRVNLNPQPSGTDLPLWSSISNAESKRTAEITGHPPQPTVKHHVVDREGTDNVRSEAIFGHGLGVHSRKREGTDVVRPFSITL